MATRQDIMNQAIWEANFDHWKPTDDEMAEIFVTAGLNLETSVERQKAVQAIGVMSES